MAAAAPTNAELKAELERLKLLKEIADLKAQLADTTKDESKTATATASHVAAAPAPATTHVVRCARVGCDRPCTYYHPTTGELYPYCGKTCGTLAKKGVTPCATSSCAKYGRFCACDFCGDRRRYPGYETSSFCSRGCVTSHEIANAQRASQCSRYGCTRPKYLDARTNILRDYCGRTCASMAGVW